MDREKIGIVGASIAGCSAAHVLNKCGYQVEVFEKRGPEEMKNLGAGLVLPEDLITELKKEKMLGQGFHAFPLTEREFLRLAPNGEDELKIGSIPMSAEAVHWGTLYNQLAKRLPEKGVHYHQRIIDLKDPSTLVTEKGAEMTYNFVLFADGYHSLGRRILFPNAQPKFTNYICWQGVFPTEETAILVRLKGKVLYYVYEKGVLLIYEIPSESNETLITWFLYEPIDKSHPFVRDQKVHVNIYEDQMTQEYLAYLHRFAEDHLPLFARDIVQRTPTPFTHAIYDTLVSSYINDKVALIGDSGILLRPHLGSGATKALQDSLRLLKAAKREKTIEKVFETACLESQQSAESLFDLSRAFGDFLVTKPPNWNNLNHDRLNQLWNGIVEGFDWYQHR